MFSHEYGNILLSLLLIQNVILKLKRLSRTYCKKLILSISEPEDSKWIMDPVTTYVCQKCDAGFRRMWDLIRHKCGQMLRYGCPYCQKKDNSSSNVYRHIRRWHPAMPVEVTKMFWDSLFMSADPVLTKSTFERLFVSFFLFSKNISQVRRL